MNYRIVRSDPDSHSAAILRLWRENLSSSGDERFSWLYRQNPLGPALTLLAVHDQGNIVGCGSLFPRRVRFGKAPYLAGIAVDFALNREHRVFGPSIQLQKALTSQFRQAGLSLILSCPNDASRGVFRRIGYQPVGEFRSWTRIVSWRPKMARLLGNERAARVPAWLAEWCCRMLDRLLLRRDPGGWQTEVVDRADDRFDRLWKGVEPDDVIMGEKSSCYLNWRYADNAVKRYLIFTLLRSRSRTLAGYVVYSIVDGTAVIADLLSESDDICLRLLVEHSREMKRQGVQAVTLSYFGNDGFTRILKRSGFIRRPQSRDIFAYCDSEFPALQRASMFDRQRWQIFADDLDLC